MKRRLSAFVWVGFLLILVAPFSYIPFFARFPSTRDFPWANLLLFGVGGAFLAVGVGRAFRHPGRFRGKVIGPVLGAAGLALCGLFLDGIFRHARDLPASRGAPRAGQVAPDFTLPDQDGHPVTLSALLSPQGGAPARAVLLIFYRGSW